MTSSPQGEQSRWNDYIQDSTFLNQVHSPVQFSQGTDPGVADEQHLVAEVLAKDRKATAEFVARCADWLYSFVRHRLAPHTDMVEDLVQEALLAAWKGLPSFRADASLRSWVLGIARHKVEDYYRKRIREMGSSEEEDSAPEVTLMPMIEQQLDSAVLQEQMQETLALLPEI